jgi:general secretion pathway protein A
MYLQHYNLQLMPFRNTPDPRFFYQTPKHNEALANLIFAIDQRRGFVLLTGEIGSGKTLCTHLLLKQVEDHAKVALIRNTHLSSTQLIRLVCDEFNVRVPEDADKAAMLLVFNQFLIQQLAEDQLVVILIDEAQNLSDKVLEELRMLSNLETSSEKLLQIVLVGQPELRDKITQPHLEQLRQRISLSYHLEPLTFEEVKSYIEHRLRIGGPEHKVVFTPEAIERIYRFSHGTPRIINGVCDNALLYGFTAGTTTIDVPLVEKVLKQSMHLAPKQRLAPSAGRGRTTVPSVPFASEQNIPTPAAPPAAPTPFQTLAAARPAVPASAPVATPPEAPRNRQVDPVNAQATASVLDTAAPSAVIEPDLLIEMIADPKVAAEIASPAAPLAMPVDAQVAAPSIAPAAAAMEEVAPMAAAVPVPAPTPVAAPAPAPAPIDPRKAPILPEELRNLSPNPAVVLG